MDTIMTKVDIHLENKNESRHFFVFLFLMYSLVYMTKNCFAAAMASIVRDGIFTKSQTGLITAVFYIVYAPLQVVGGMLSDKYSPERLLKISMIGIALINIGIFFNHNYYFILTLWSLNAIVQTPIWSAVFKIISSQLVRSDRKQMVFLISFSNSLGLLMGYIVAAVIPKWEYTFLFSAFAMIICTIIIHIFCKRLNGLMKDDKKVKIEEVKETYDNNISAIKLFTISGLFVLLPGVLIRCMLELGTKTLSPTMLMETYNGISPSIGNMLNTLIIISGIIGTLLVRFFVYPRIIKNEAFGIFLMIAAAIPFAVFLKMIGHIPVWGAVLSLCGISITLTSTHFLISCVNLYFVPYGKNGLAAGISNGAACVGIILESYGFVKIAEKYSWNTVTSLWIVMLIIAAILTALSVPLLRRFKEKKQY